MGGDGLCIIGELWEGGVGGGVQGWGVFLRREFAGGVKWDGNCSGWVYRGLVIPLVELLW